VAQQAIRWAVKEGVHIINLSFGYRNCIYPKFHGLMSALDDAKSQNIVVFAATSNEGAHDPVAWPARAPDFAIGIHSSSDSGQRQSEFTANRFDGNNFAIVGENILSQWPTSKGGGFRLCTGTSFATPIAAAVGALILAFASQKLCHRERVRTQATISLEELHTNSGMTKVLQSISSEKAWADGQYLWIHSRLFWKDYDDDGDKAKALRHAWDVIEKALKM
jgi:Subtilase family